MDKIENLTCSITIERSVRNRERNRSYRRPAGIKMEPLFAHLDLMHPDLTRLDLTHFVFVFSHLAFAPLDCVLLASALPTFTRLAFTHSVFHR